MCLYTYDIGRPICACLPMILAGPVCLSAYDIDRPMCACLPRILAGPYVPACLGYWQIHVLFFLEKADPCAFIPIILAGPCVPACL